MTKRVTVGAAGCDVAGFTNRHIQEAIDRVAAAGGGTVELSEGTFALADSVHLASGMTLRGAGERTVLRKDPMKSSPVACFLGYGHYDVVVERPDVFEAGEGIYLESDRAGGFLASVGTLVGRDGDTWFTNRPHAMDYTVRDRAVARTLFPLLDATDVSDAAAEGLALDGNAAENPVRINGCRGAGAYAIRSARVAFRDLLIRDCNCDGVSFQTCDDLAVSGCRIERCRGNGLHPGSGSNRFHVKGCRVIGAAECGLFYCLRVRESVLEDSLFENCGSDGVSIGSRDTGHVNRRLTVRGCGGAGVRIRRCSRADAADNNLIENCLIEENCAAGGLAEVVIEGATKGLRVVGCRIGCRGGKGGILIQPEVLGVELERNSISPAGAGAVVDRRGEAASFEPEF